MPETTFEMLPLEVQEEVRQLSVDLGWSLERAADEYLEMGRSLALQAQLKQVRRKAPVLSLVGHKKGLD
ncbi:hypothetical protein J2Y39_004463 [Pseudomonas sp. 2957]|jgi:hypothetical protein|uniref:CopG family transcriptional regulator n=1 Tax=Pseudomonas fluorescens TaxID=294 RepID=A0A5E7HZD2_PSEFL|nr:MULTISPECIES: hypothetical protein [Pseudomonas]MCU7216612.1 hypothetical protein [Pseudomonas sp. VE 196-7]MDR6949838.1 hypothetical protein [Pseudomonas sp. 2957]VVO69831.1 hypothetical protein PS847_01247 [Pseudomonas fluorescens]